MILEVFYADRRCCWVPWLSNGRVAWEMPWDIARRFRGEVYLMPQGWGIVDGPLDKRCWEWESLGFAKRRGEGQ